jgi:hypothetical protein
LSENILSPLSKLKLFKNFPADIVSERVQSLSEKEFALGGPIDIGPRMSEDTVSADLNGFRELNSLKII